MEKILTSTLLKSSILIIFLFIFLPIISFAQISEEILIKDAIAFSKDRYNSIYYVTNNQDVKKYGDDKLIFSSHKRKQITNLEAWNSIKIFLFNEEYQEYTILDRYLTEMFTTPFDIENVGFASFATIALDGNVWLFDNTDFSIKKISIQNGKVISKTPLNLIIKESENEVLFMKEYANFLYISTEHNGILVFDNLGTYKKKLPFNNVIFFDFNEQSLYFTTNKGLTYFDLIKLETTIIEKEISYSKYIETGKKAFTIK